MRSFWDRASKRWVPEEEWRGPVGKPAGPMIMKDVPEHRSPVDGSMLTSRSHRREHLKRHRLVELGDDPIKPRTPTPMPPVAESLKRAYERMNSK